MKKRKPEETKINVSAEEIATINLNLRQKINNKRLTEKRRKQIRRAIRLTWELLRGCDGPKDITVPMKKIKFLRKT